MPNTHTSERKPDSGYDVLDFDSPDFPYVVTRDNDGNLPDMVIFLNGASRGQEPLLMRCVDESIDAAWPRVRDRLRNGGVFFEVAFPTGEPRRIDSIDRAAVQRTLNEYFELYRDTGSDRLVWTDWSSPEPMEDDGYDADFVVITTEADHGTLTLVRQDLESQLDLQFTEVSIVPCVHNTGRLRVRFKLF